MSCEMNEHPFGWEIRCYLRGDFHYSHVSRTRELAEQDAQTKRRELSDDRRCRYNRRLQPNTYNL
jgi:hypothetical protein